MRQWSENVEHILFPRAYMAVYDEDNAVSPNSIFFAKWTDSTWSM